VLTLRATSYDIMTSRDGRTWHRVGRVRGRTSGRRDVLSFPSVRARFVEVRIHASTHHTVPKLQEVRLTGSG
jgi:hypothetical protein